MFVDTNVLVAAYLWPGGRCQEVLELIWTEHDFLTSEVVIDELVETFARKFDISLARIAAIESDLRFYHVEPWPRSPYELDINDEDDLWILAAAVAAGSDILVTGDREVQSANSDVAEMEILSPGAFIERFGIDRS
ncbi:MAG: putative toxin-antitoxin system toxin component, PIN family [Opitutales bacterium]